MKILFIAPIPPPIHGMSIVSSALFRDLKKDHDVSLIDTAKKLSTGAFAVYIRLNEVVNILVKVFLSRKKHDVIYIGVSQSLLGNLKDIVTFMLLYTELHKVVIHLHGGEIKKVLWSNHPRLFRLNRHFISRLSGAIISGKSHMQIYDDIISKDKIHIVSNYADDQYFINPPKIKEKFQNGVLKLLFIGGMREKKGYLDLLEAYLMLDTDEQDSFQLDYAGEFGSITEKNLFLKRIKNIHSINYHGIVSESQKRVMLHEANIFCLPTKYYEGQPISILEAYASGCVVMTTLMGGIVDVFDEKVNGLHVSPGNSSTIRDSLNRVLRSRASLCECARLNRKYAAKCFSREKFSSLIKQILEETGIEE